MILALAILPRIYHLNYPYIDYHGFRQSDTANVARNFYEHGFNILYPEAAEFGQGNGAYEMEFGLVPFLVAMLYLPFGVHEWVAHSVSIAFSLLTIYLIYALALHYFSMRTALLASFFAALMPLSIYFGRAMMPESAMLAFSVASVLFGVKFHSSGNRRNLLLAALFLSLAVLLKVTSLYLLLPLAFLVLSSLGWKSTPRSPLVWFALAIVLVPSILWYGYAHFVIFRASGLGFSIWDFQSRSATRATLMEPALYIAVWDHLINLIFGPVGLVLFLLGFFLSLRHSNLLFVTWCGAIFIYMVGTAGRLQNHSYYLLPLVPPAAILMSLASWAMFDILRPSFGQARPQPKQRWDVIRWLISLPYKHGQTAFVLGTIAAFLVSSYLGLAVISHGGAYAGGGDVAIYTAGRIVESLAPEGPRVAVEFGNPHKPGLVYYGHRDTYFLYAPFSSASLEELRSRGATFFISTDMDQYRANVEFMVSMRSKYRLVTDGEQYFAFDLTSKPEEPFVPSHIAASNYASTLSFGGIIALENVTVGPSRLAAGGAFFLGLRWRLLNPPLRDYLIGIKCSQGDRIAWSWDHVLGLGWTPAITLQAGSVVDYNLTFIVPPFASPGPCSLTIEVGWPSLLVPKGLGATAAGRPVIAALQVESSTVTPYDLLLEPYFPGGF